MIEFKYFGIPEKPQKPITTITLSMATDAALL